MPKEYYCNKLLDNGIVCGERNIEKFISGRYTTCKPCRLRSMSVYNKSKTIKKKDEESTKLDPDCNMRWLIEDTIKRVPFMGTQTIIDRIENSEADISDVLNIHHEYVDKTNEIIKLLQTQIQNLQIEMINLKEQISKK